MFVFLATILLVLLVPLPAFAFGPIAHVDMGMDVIAEAAGLASAAWSVIRTHRQDFLRGTLGPDREVAKNLAAYENHTHNWDRVFRQLEEATTDAQRAFFLGCLCHLAADVVAHNYFVPQKIVESHRSRFAAHLYWEMRFDARSRRQGGELALKALGLNRREHRRFLENVVPGNILGPRFNVRMTGLAMRVQRAMAFQSMAAYVDRESRLVLTDDHAQEVRSLAMAAQMAVVHLFGMAPVVSVDARGIDSLELAGRIRRQLKDLVRRHGEPNHEARMIVAGSREHFRANLAGLGPTSGGAGRFGAGGGTR